VRFFVIDGGTASHNEMHRMQVEIALLTHHWASANVKMNCHSLFVTGVIDKRLPRFSTTRSLSLPPA
jgi:hypothetical protein